jgi:hypothetical protein
MAPSVKLVTMHQWSPVETVPSATVAEKLYPDTVRRELQEGDFKTKRLFWDLVEYYDAGPSAEEQHRIAGCMKYETEMLQMMDSGLAKEVEVELSVKIATRHGETPNGCYNVSFRPFISSLFLPFTSIPWLLDVAYANYANDYIPWDIPSTRGGGLLRASAAGRTRRTRGCSRWSGRTTT